MIPVELGRNNCWPIQESQVPQVLPTPNLASAAILRTIAEEQPALFLKLVHCLFLLFSLASLSFLSSTNSEKLNVYPYGIFCCSVSEKYGRDEIWRCDLEGQVCAVVYWPQIGIFKRHFPLLYGVEHMNMNTLSSSHL